MQTLDQKRAEFAWQQVSGKGAAYKNLAKSTPALIMSNGLMQTLAFLKANGKEEHKDLLESIRKWLKEQKLLADEKDFKDVMQELYKMDSLKYQRATEESLAILRWIRQLADAAISK